MQYNTQYMPKIVLQYNTQYFPKNVLQYNTQYNSYSTYFFLWGKLLHNLLLKTRYLNILFINFNYIIYVSLFLF